MKFDINFVTTILIPIISIIVTVIIYFFQKTKKQIAYKIISSQSFPTYDKPLTELEFPNKAVVIEYINAGNTALEKLDFHKPINTYFPNAKIIEVKKYFPGHNDAIELEIKFNGSNAWFTPDLINPKESVFLYFFVQEFHNKVGVSSRIINGRPVFNKAFNDNLKEKVSLVFLFYLAALISNVYKTGKLRFIDSAVTILGFSGVYASWFIRDYRNIKKRQFL